MNENFIRLEPFFGSWHMVELIGEGSFGKVYKIKRDTFGKEQFSALKIIQIPQSQAELDQAYSEGLDDESATNYFKSLVDDITREIELMSKFIGNSNIVSYADHQIIKNQEGLGWTVLIRMELLTSLKDYILKNKPTQHDVIKLGIDICHALELCKKHSIIHRDIKAENIFISDNGDYKLGDFGIARQLEKTMSGLSKKGTYTYMAPEVYLGKPYNASVDIYSLGIVMYRLLNDNRAPFMPPFPAPITFSDREKAQNKQMSGEKMPPPKNANEKLAGIIQKACAFTPADRFESPSKMRDALMSFDLYQTPIIEPAEKESNTVVPLPVSSNDVFSHSYGYAPESATDDKTESLFEKTDGFGFTSRDSGSPPKLFNGYTAYNQPPSVNAYNQSTSYNRNLSGQVPRPKKKNTTWLIFAVAVSFIFVVIAAAAIIFAINNKRENDSDNDANSNSEVTTQKAKSTVGQTTAKPTDPTTTTRTDNNAALIAAIKSARVGGTVYFGNFEQDNNTLNGKETVAWRVLAIENGEALLISEKILDCAPYNETRVSITWEACSLRNWLNNDFCNNTFTQKEKMSIASTALVNKNNPYNETNGGNSTTDKVFILSYEEAGKYLTDENARQAQATDFAKSKGLYVSAGEFVPWGNSNWWLRTPGSNPGSALFIYFDGRIGRHYDYVDYKKDGVRPALWLNLQS